MRSPKPAPLQARRRKIQLPYLNTFDTIWQYRESFLSGQIVFRSFIGPICPLCGKERCYRQITSYWRYAIELFPQFKRERIPIARFVCRTRLMTFSLLPVQLIPYFQYTVHAVLGTLLMGLQCWHRGQRGFHGASIGVDPDSLVSPWLVAYWLTAILRGLRRAHGVLRRWYDLSRIRTCGAWKEIWNYFVSLGWERDLQAVLWQTLERYSRSTKQFIFGTPSQDRIRG